MPSRRGSGDVLARAGDTGLARWLAAAQPWEHGIAQTERGASFRGTVTVLGAVAPHRRFSRWRNRLTFFTVSLTVFKDCGGFV